MFLRQWLSPKKEEETECRDQLAAMIRDPESAQPAADFEEVMSKCRCLLEKIVMDMPKSFLLEAAERVCHKLQPDSATASEFHQLPAKSNGKNDVPLAVVAVEKLTYSDEQITDDVAETTPSAINGSSTGLLTSHISATKSTKISSVDDMWHPATEWKRGAGRAGGKTPWGTVEEEQVYRGVLAHGVGNWAVIRANFVPNRSNVDIKDKWRTMKRQGRLHTLADKLGPLPASCLY